jgi:hypothetical protein
LSFGTTELDTALLSSLGAQRAAERLEPGDTKACPPLAAEVSLAVRTTLTGARAPVSPDSYSSNVIVADRPSSQACGRAGREMLSWAEDPMLAEGSRDPETDAGFFWHESLLERIPDSKHVVPSCVMSLWLTCMNHEPRSQKWTNAEHSH